MLPRLTPHIVALLAFFAFYILLVQDVRHWSTRDPSSVFFRPETAFQRAYSLQRQQQAEDWIVSAKMQYSKAAASPSLCIGIPTVQREDARYFRRAVGSVLAGLTEQERADIYMMPLIANPDPLEHLAYKEPWLDLVSDEVLTYADAPKDIAARVRELERNDENSDRKPMFDYIYLLRACYDREIPYIVMLEDDTIAADGWYYQTKEALQTLSKANEIEAMVYLRLFYNEGLLGWNSEEWFTYLLWCLAMESILLLSLTLVKRFVPVTRSILTRTTIAVLGILVLPLVLALYFAAGRLTVSRLQRGLSRMDIYGCCSQALVFARNRIPDLIAFYERRGSGKIDSLTEIYANERTLARWALTPSVFAHVGSTSSKGTGGHLSTWGRKNTDNIWNFEFETFDGEELKGYHVG